ncbi:tripartite tricarboxylate transporter permease [Corynebacterium sp. YIM 101645]|uniref:Tripartite tricarboxylate transporter permease n=1 Tax=Corynebacterium lemuris TaxID=1859292 RepID=A0ABT2FTN9_9CORY|nr:tripartite tricarboxylate transporter permease [Corynebacterium lemuris]MCS5478175.1 tripartite tricarboxylate transporter permease [Corynebacterium lemuris]
MDLLTGLAGGFSVAADPMNLLFVTLGVALGTIIGLLPGLGASAAIAILLPITFNMDPTSAIIMLAGIYYGAMYGGRIPAILLNVPGDASSVITTLEGYPLARKGQAGPALGLTAISSFIGGTVALIGLTFLAPMIATWAGRIGPPETVVLAMAGLLMAALIGSGSKVKVLSMVVVGLLLATIGFDLETGQPRFSFGSNEFAAGIQVIPLAVGLFGIGEILFLTEAKIRGLDPRTTNVRGTPSFKAVKEQSGPIGRSSIIGFLIGIIPGGGGSISSIVAYGVQKKVSKNPEMYGKGAMDGLAATETADNASSSSAFIPLLTLGLPPNPTLALLFGALVMHNVTPGPNMVNSHPEVFWGVIASMYIGNIILLAFNLPLIGLFTKILKVPVGILFPIVLVIAFCGVYASRSSLMDVYMAAIFGVVGYLLKKFRFDMTPIILAFILGAIIESNFRTSLTMGDGSLMIFVERPITLIILGVLGAAALGLYLMTRSQRKTVQEIREEVRDTTVEATPTVSAEITADSDQSMVEEKDNSPLSR